MAMEVKTGDSNFFKLFSVGCLHSIFSLACVKLAVPVLLGLSLAASAADVENYGEIYAVARQADGKYIVGGDFTLLNGVPCGYLARLNTDGSVDASWTAQAAADGPVRAVCVGSDGVYVGGAFTNIGGGTSPCLAKLSAASGMHLSAWAPPAPDREVALIVVTNSDVYIAGDFRNLGSTSRRFVARLDASDGTFDSAWNPSPNGQIYGLVPDYDASMVYLGGSFTYIGSPAIAGMALRRCSADTGAPDQTWTPSLDEAIYSMIAVDPQRGSGVDCLLIGGNFTFNTGSKRGLAMIKKSDGSFLNESTYASLPSGYPVAFTEPIYDASNGDLAYVYAVGEFTTGGGTDPRNVAKIWCGSGAAESNFKPNPDAMVYAAAATTNGVVAGGVFTEVYRYQASPSVTVTDAALSLVKLDYTYDGSSGGFGWHAARDSSFGGKATKQGLVRAMVTDTNGAVFIGGEFELVDETPRLNLAKIDADGSLDTGWQCDISDHGDGSAAVYALALGDAELLNNTNLYVGGTFATVGGFGRNNLARINPISGTPDVNWYPDPNGRVRALAITNYDLYVGGDFTQISARERERMAKLSALSHAASTVFDPGANDSIHALAVSEEGGTTYLYAGGDFTAIAQVDRNRIAKLSSSIGDVIGAWDAEADAPVYALETDDHYMYAAGAFTNIGGVAQGRLARFSRSLAGTVDTSWTPAPDGPVTALLVDGYDIYAGGCFVRVGDVGVTNLARLHYDSGAADAAWTPDPRHACNASACVRALGRGTTNLYLGGDFATVDAATAPGFALTESLASPVWQATSQRETNSFVLNWQAVSGAERYFLDVAIDPAFTSNVPGYSNRDVFTNTFCAVTNLATARTYYARLRALNGAGYSQYSARLSPATRNAPLVPGWTDEMVYMNHSGVHSIQYSPAGDLYLSCSEKDNDNVFMPGAMYLRKRPASAVEMDAFGDATLIGANRGQAALRSAITLHFSEGGTNHLVGESGVICAIMQSDDDGTSWSTKRGYSVFSNSYWPAYLPSYFTEDDKLRLFYGFMSYRDETGVPVVMHVDRTDNPAPMEWPYGGSTNIVQIGDGRLAGAYENGSIIAVFTDKGILFSSDNGATFATNTALPASAAAVGGDELIYLLHVATNEGIKTLSLAASDDGALTWDNPRSIVYEGAQDVAYPRLAAWSNRVLAVWRHGDAGDLVCCESVNTGETWGATSVLFSASARVNYMVWSNEPGFAVATHDGTFSVAVGITNNVGTLPQLQLSAFALTNNVLLRWPSPESSGAATNIVQIRYSSTGYPESITDGEAVYTGSDQEYEHTGRTPGQTCYYSLFTSDDGTTFFDPTQTNTSAILFFERDE
jgi:hypothetical protein